MIRVLIVDDDKLARKGLISIMPWSMHDMEVVGEAANGAKALEFLEKNPVDLVFVDLSMPVLSGIELIEEICIQYPNLYFIVLTFYEDFEYIQKTLRLGALDYISKVRMDTENYTKILDRIQQRIEYELKHKNNHLSLVKNVHDVMPAKKTVSSIDKAVWHTFEQHWRSLHWLYDDTEFENLCASMSELNPPVRSIEDLFIRITSIVEVNTRIEIEIQFNIATLEDASAWIHNYRDLIYSQVSQYTDLLQVAICILKAILFVRNQIAMPIHTETVAAQVNMSRGYFCQCFKKMVGITFNEYIRRERIRIAKHFLSQPNRSVTWIAQAVGYGDVKYFSRIFKEQAGFLPSEYRLQFLKSDK